MKQARPLLFAAALLALGCVPSGPVPPVRAGEFEPCGPIGQCAAGLTCFEGSAECDSTGTLQPFVFCARRCAEDRDCSKFRNSCGGADPEDVWSWPDEPMGFCRATCTGAFSCPAYPGWLCGDGLCYLGTVVCTPNPGDVGTDSGS